MYHGEHFFCKREEIVAEVNRPVHIKEEETDIGKGRDVAFEYHIILSVAFLYSVGQTPYFLRKSAEK